MSVHGVLGNRRKPMAVDRLADNDPEEISGGLREQQPEHRQPAAGTDYPYPGWGRDRRRPPVRSRQTWQTEFPANWDEDKIIDSILSVARPPDSGSLQRN
jgi:hypothetical protein